MRRLALAAALWLAAPLAQGAEEDRGFLAGLISRALSSRATQVSIGAVEGALSSDATIRDVMLSDRDGPWLKLDRARLSWNRLALFKRRLEVERLEIGHIVWSRPALKAQAAAPGEPMSWPDLPLKAIVKHFEVESLDLGAPVLGAAARLGFEGAATLGSPKEGLGLALAARRLDAPGALDVKLKYAPDTHTLALALDAEEPAGGLLAGAAHLPGAPPLTFRFDGAGPLDAFHAQLAFAAGPEIGAAGDVDLARDGAGRRLRLALNSRLSGLMPALAAPVFAGETKLTGEARLGDDGGVTTQGVTLESEAAALEVAGAVSAQGEADVKIDAHAKPNAQLAKLALLGAVKGALPRPAVDLTFAVEGLTSAAATLARAEAKVAARPDAGDALAISAVADMSGLKLADPALAPLVGEAGRLALRARATADGALDVAELTLEAAALRARFSGKAAANALDGQLAAEAPDLSRLSALTGLALKGSARAQAKLSGATTRPVAEVTARAENFASGVAALDGFAGATPALAGRVALTEGYAFDKLTLTGAGGSLRLDGQTGARLDAQLAVPDAHRLDPRVAGALTARASLTGPLDAPNLDLAAALADGRLLGRPARLDLTAQARGGGQAALRLGGEIDGKPLTGEVAAARAPDAWTLDRLAFHLGQIRVEGAGKLSGGLAEGRLTVAAPRLDDLSPLALTPLSGALSAEVRLDAEAGKQNATVRAKANEAALGATRVSGLDLDMKITDALGDAGAEGMATAARLFAAGETVSAIKLAAKAQKFDLSATLRGLAVNAKGALHLAARTLRLDALSAKGRDASLALAAPATLTLADGGVEADRLAFKLGAGRAIIQGRLGPRPDLTAKAEAVPLALAEIVSPGLGLTGTAAGEARLQGEAGDWRLALTGVAAASARNAGLPPLDVKASGRLAGGRTSLEASVSAGAAGVLRLSGAAPLGPGALDLRAQGRLDLAPLTRTLAARGQRASGTVTLDARLTGDLAHPRAEGGAMLSGGAFSDDVSGLRLTDAQASLAAHGDAVEIARASARTPGGGSVSASGRVRLAPGYPADIHVSADNARLVATDVVTADAGLALDVTGPLVTAPRLAGRIDVKALDVEIPGRLPGASAPLADVRHIDPGPAARARLALMAKARRRAGAGFDAALALTVAAPARVTVHGRGVDAEFGGELKVAGTTASPRVSGGFDLRRGSLTLIGGPMAFSRGAVRFEGDALPRLDLEARQSVSDITAIVDVTGPADKPVFAFSSSPELPQDEVLSRLLFQKPSGNLSAFQALQLANTVSALSGNGGAFDTLRRSLGVDSLDVSTGSSGGPALSARRALSERLSLGVKTGARPEDNGVLLDLDVTKRLRLSTGVDAKGESSVGAGMQWEY
jgi:translocation and assembly module TamB